LQSTKTTEFEKASLILKIFNILYYTNLLLIVGALFYPVFQSIGRDDIGMLDTIYYISLIAIPIGVVLCPSFFVLNVIGIFIDKHGLYKTKYFVVSLIMLLMILGGILGYDNQMP